MQFDDGNTLYDILDLSPDASPQEIREAYLRIKATYGKDSAALYSLVDSSEREQILQQIEDAYEVLSNPEKRKEYDRFHGPLMQPEETPPVFPSKVVSIDRVPPMESTETGESLLVPPSTDFTPVPPAPPAHPVATPPQAGIAVSAPNTEAAVQSPPSIPRPPVVVDPVAQFMKDLEQETEWRGSVFRKVREARRISIEEITSTTKISKTYLLALEEENYSRLPAAVFVRGFVTQVARVLKLPNQQGAVTAYMARFNQAAAKAEK